MTSVASTALAFAKGRAPSSQRVFRACAATAVAIGCFAAYRHFHAATAVTTATKTAVTTAPATAVTTAADPEDQGVLMIAAADIPRYLVTTSGENASTSRWCDATVAETLAEEPRPVDAAHYEVTDEQLAEVARSVRPGGEWWPDGGGGGRNCTARHHTAVLVCYRDRPGHLRAFLYHVHRFLRRQGAARYRVYVVEQDAGGAFNRGAVFNAGYREVAARSAAGCFVLHDVDLIPEHAGNVFGCTACPRVMCAVDKYGYRARYATAFGGAVAMTRGQYAAANGFSNAYRGWGREDDDLYLRVRAAGMRACRFDDRVSRYTMLRHAHAVPAGDADALLRDAPRRFAADGVNSVQYRLLAYEELPLYTRILVAFSHNYTV